MKHFFIAKNGEFKTFSDVIHLTSAVFGIRTEMWAKLDDFGTLNRNVLEKANSGMPHAVIQTRKNKLWQGRLRATLTKHTSPIPQHRLVAKMCYIYNENVNKPFHRRADAVGRTNSDFFRWCSRKKNNPVKLHPYVYMLIFTYRMIVFILGWYLNSCQLIINSTDWSSWQKIHWILRGNSQTET